MGEGGVNKKLQVFLLLLFLTTAGCEIPPEWVRTKQSEETRRICDVYKDFEPCFRRNFPIGSNTSVAHKFLIDSGFNYQGVRSDTIRREYVREAHDLTPLKIRIQISEKNQKIDYIHLVQG
jgi:hypothetical protein